MKIVYCDRCREISTLARFEPERCSHCGREARLVPYQRPWQYYVGPAALLAVAAYLFLVPIDDLLTRLGIFGLALVVAIVFSQWSMSVVRTRVRRTATQAQVVSEAKP